jgi:hypothetical protein
MILFTYTNDLSRVSRETLTFCVIPCIARGFGPANPLKAS